MAEGVVYPDSGNDEERLQEAISTPMTHRSSFVNAIGAQRLSQASIKFFQIETSTSTRNLSISIVAATSTAWTEISTRNLVACLDGCDNG